MSSQRSVACEDKRGPTRTARSKDLAQRLVKNPQFFLFADPLAIGRIAKDDTGRSGRRLKSAHVFDFETDQVADARCPRVISRKDNSVFADVRAKDRRRQFLEHAAPGLVAQLGPQPNVKIHPALEAKTLPCQTRRSMKIDPGRLNGKAPRSASGISYVITAFPP